MQTAHAIDIGVQTADAERPSFEYRNNDVRLTFTDWKEEVVSLIFHDVLAVSWQDAESSGPQDRDDCAFEIKNSDWMALQKRRVFWRRVSTTDISDFALMGLESLISSAGAFKSHRLGFSWLCRNGNSIEPSEHAIK